ncbi:MAG TPA: hypothetical protein VF950_18835 [Planctomycetota bacterium]
MARVLILSAIILGLGAVSGPAPQASDGARPARSPFTVFESGPVRPLALSPDGGTLFACNIPDNRLEVFAVGPHGLRHRGSVPVGLEPVAVAARSAGEAWVVNHLSDSVSVVRIEEDDDKNPKKERGGIGRVVRTLLVGDEPRDIVLAGAGRGRAFVTTAHRGQNVPYDPQLTIPGVPRADVWVFEAANPDAPPSIVKLFTDTPRGLAVSPDGSRVYAAGFHTGNRTTTVFEDVVRANGGLTSPYILVAPNPAAPDVKIRLPINHQGLPQPFTGLIVKFRDGKWLDEEGRDWSAFVKFNLPDRDVFAIDALASPPVEVGSWSGVGTVLFNLAVNPVSGKIYVSNTDARNENRFEGPGAFAGRTVRGHVVENRITVLDGPAAPAPRHLNKHIDFSGPFLPIPNDVNRRSLAFPLDLAVSADGETLYVAAFGSSKVGVYDTAELETDAFVPDAGRQIDVPGGGPCGLALDERHDRLYVLTRFDNAVKEIDLRGLRPVKGHALFSAEPSHVVKGRRFLYDASFSSSRGDTACASCHIFGDFDSLAWDLGDPDGVQVENTGILTVPGEPFDVPRHFRPMKGPMATQSLRGMANHGAMHWRGDRLNNSEPPVQPDGGAFDERTAFEKFNPAFVGLNGRDATISGDDMRAFTDFILELAYPPNPVRRLDDEDTATQARARDVYMGARKTDSFFNCNGCHVLDPDGNRAFGVSKPGFFGSDGRFSFELEPQVFKIPHLRNMYQKVGMFGMPRTQFILPGDNDHKGDQVRGFGFMHDGSCDTLFRFHTTIVFFKRAPGTISPRDPGNPDGFPPDLNGFLDRKAMEDFMLAFPSNLKPIVGQQATLTDGNLAALGDRLALMIARAEARDCDLIARVGDRGFLYLGAGLFRPDRRRDAPVADLALRARATLPGGEVTYTCVPPGSGYRLALDRDEDGKLDGDERP